MAKVPAGDPAVEKPKKDFPKLGPGYHRVMINGIRQHNGQAIVGLSNKNGEFGLWVDPSNPEGDSNLWTILAGFDYPSVEFWENATEDTDFPENINPAWGVLNNVMSQGREVVIYLNEYEIKRGPNKGKMRTGLQAIYSLERHADLMGDNDPGPDSSLPANADGHAVPF